MRLIAALAVLALSAAPAFAQTPLTGTTGAPTTAPPPAAVTPPAAVAPSAPARAARPHRTLQQRFDEANTTHDGHLTREQAHSKMPMVYKNFDSIDADRKGYVTVDDIKADAKTRRAARKAAKQAQ